MSIGLADKTSIGQKFGNRKKFGNTKNWTGGNIRISTVCCVTWVWNAGHQWVATKNRQISDFLAWECYQLFSLAVSRWSVLSVSNWVIKKVVRKLYAAFYQYTKSNPVPHSIPYVNKSKSSDSWYCVDRLLLWRLYAADDINQITDITWCLRHLNWHHKLLNNQSKHLRMTYLLHIDRVIYENRTRTPLWQ